MSFSQVHFMSKSQDWATPWDFYDTLTDEFTFTLDPCATKATAKCISFYTKEQDGLTQDWGSNSVFCNPPYGRGIGEWVKKCAEAKGLVVALLPARTDTRWFHDYIYGKAEIRFLRGRLKFGGAKFNAPFPCFLAIWRKP